MATSPVKVTITYCSECGYEPQTLALAEVLMRAFGHALGEIKLIPWFDGSFEVTVNGELVHSMYRDGGFPDESTVIEAVRRLVAPDAPARQSQAAGQAG